MDTFLLISTLISNLTKPNRSQRLRACFSFCAFYMILFAHSTTSVDQSHFLSTASFYTPGTNLYNEYSLCNYCLKANDC